MLKISNKLRIIALFSIFLLIAPLGLMAQETYSNKYLQFGNQFSQTFKMAKVGDALYIRDFGISDVAKLLKSTPIIKLDLSAGIHIDLQFISNVNGNIVVECSSRFVGLMNGYNYENSFGYEVRGFGCYPVVGPSDTAFANFDEAEARLSETVFVLSYDVNSGPVCEVSLQTTKKNLTNAKLTIAALEREVKRLKALLPKK